MSLRHLVHVVSLILLALSVALAATFLVALLLGDGDAPAFAISAGGAAFLGLIGFWRTEMSRELSLREGYAVVSLAWVAVGLVGAAPYLLTGALPSPVEAWFESVSGFTTTGATVFNHIDDLPRGLLFWRALTQWVGGMGIIVLGVAVLPFLGVGGMQLFKAEVPGPTPERLRPRIAQTAKLLWYVYAAATVVVAVLFLLGGLSPFDAITHAFSTISTGGFSPHDASIGGFASPYVDYVTIIFMYLSAINFTLHYRALSGRPGIYLRDPEWRFFTGLLVSAALLVFVLILQGGDYAMDELEPAFRAALFQTTSLLTGTGFVTANYERWAIGAQFVLLLVMFVGGMAGSTAGGIKVLRVSILVRHALGELKKSLHPRAVILTRLGNRPIEDDVLLRILSFVIIYMILFGLGALVLTILGHDFVTAAGASAASIGNVGPGLGAVGATDHYGWMGPLSQLTLTFLMLVGRLELFTVLLLFHPGLWRSRR